MSLRARLTGHFVARSLLVLSAIALVVTAWVIGVWVWAQDATSPQMTGVESPAKLMDLIVQATDDDGRTIDVSALGLLTVNNGWVLVLDAKGTPVYSLDVPPEIPDPRAVGSFAHLAASPEAYGQGSLLIRDSPESSLTWVIGSTRTWVMPLEKIRPTHAGYWVAFTLPLLFSIGIIVSVSWALGGSMVRPFAHMMEWLESLAGGVYAEPLNRRGFPESRRKNGKLRRPYQTYKEVFEALDTLTAELDRVSDEQARLETTREEWIAGVSHDVRTPLASVRGYADLLAMPYDFGSEEVREKALVIREQADRIDELLGDLSLAYRLRNGALPLTRESIDAVELVRDVVVDIANDPRSARRNVRFDDPGEDFAPVIRVDAAWFRRALGNLLVNAVVHNPPGTTVTAGIATRADSVVITVSDDGRGMDDETVKRLFDRYFRGTASDTPGSGLGMAIARQLIEANGGTIDVISEPGRGTVLEVRQPLES